MKKVKTMENCLGTGKVCNRIRSNYNQLVCIISSLNALEAGECGDAIVYDVVHQAMATVKDELCKKIHKSCLKCERKQNIKRAKDEVEAAEHLVQLAKQDVQEAVWANNAAYNAASERAFEDITEEELEGLDDDAIIDIGLDAAFADELFRATEEVVLDAQRALKIAEKVLEDKMKVLLNVSGSFVDDNLE